MTVSVDLDHRPPLTFYLSVGLVAGSIIALQIGIMRVFSVGSWAHFGSLVVSLAMFGFGLTIGGDVRRPRAGSSATGIGADQGRAAGLRAADGGVQPRRPAGAVQRHLPDLRPDAEVAAARQLRALFPAVPGRRALSRRRLPQGAEDLQPRLLRRPRGLGPVRPVGAAGACTVFTPDDLIMAPLLLWLAGGLLWFVALGDRRGMLAIVGVARAVGRRALRRAAGCSASPSSRCRTTRASSYARKFPDNQRTYERASPFGYLEVYSSSYLHFAPGQSRQRRVQPARTCRPTPISACTSIRRARRASSRTCRPSETAYFRYLPMYYPYVLKQEPEHLRGPVRRRHLDRGGAEVGLRARHGRRGQSGGADGVPRGQGPARLHRRHPQQSQGHRHRL